LPRGYHVIDFLPSYFSCLFSGKSSASRYRNLVTETADDCQRPAAFVRLVAGTDVSPLAGVDIEPSVIIKAPLGSLVVRPQESSGAGLLRAGEVTRADG